MQEGIDLMYSRELLDVEYTSCGIFYKSNPLSSFLLIIWNLNMHWI